MFEGRMQVPAGQAALDEESSKTRDDHGGSNILRFSLRPKTIRRALEKEIISEIFDLARRADEAGMQSVAALLVVATFIVEDNSRDPDDGGGGAALQNRLHRHGWSEHY